MIGMTHSFVRAAAKTRRLEILMMQLYCRCTSLIIQYKQIGLSPYAPRRQLLSINCLLSRVVFDSSSSLAADSAAISWLTRPITRDNPLTRHCCNNMKYHTTTKWAATELCVERVAEVIIAEVIMNPKYI